MVRREYLKFLNWPTSVRIGYDVIALIVGAGLGLFFSGQYTIAGILSASSINWVPFLLLTPVIGIACFWNLGLYTSLRSRNVNNKANQIVIGNALVFLVLGIALSFFKEVTLGKLLAFFLAWLFSTALLLLPRLVYDLARKELNGHAEKLAAVRARSVLVIGGGGYIGSALVPRLLNADYEVVVLDLLAFGNEPIRHFMDHPKVRIVREDYRNVETLVKHIRGVESVVHLGGLVGDPACAVDEKLTIDVNVTSTRLIAELAKSHGVKRFLFASSCSIYGANDEIVDESSTLNPQSLYAKTKVASEVVLSEFASREFEPVYLRFGTIYGLSGRTRFDLVVNLLSAKSLLSGEITVFGSDQWRPFVHVDDVAHAVELALKAPARIVANQAFNVGSNGQNFTLMEVAQKINELVPSAKILVTDENVDRRNYRVDFSKIKTELGFEPRWTLVDGISQVIDAIREGKVSDIDQQQYSNLKLLRERGADLFKKTYNHGWEEQYLAQVKIEHTVPQ